MMDAKISLERRSLTWLCPHERYYCYIDLVVVKALAASDGK